MGSNLKKIRSLNLITKILFIGIILSSGFFGTVFLNNLLKESYIKRKSELEKSIESLLDKDVDLGDYSGIRFLGFALGNSRINDKENINSLIKAKNVFVGIMPIRSFLSQKWIIKISPKQAEINIERDFFTKDKGPLKSKERNKSKFNYDLVFNLNKYSNLNLNDFGIGTKVKGNVIYRFKNNELLANLKSKFDAKGVLRLKVKTNFKKDLFSLKVFSRGVNLQSSKYKVGDRKFAIKKGNFKSNFKFYKSSKKTFCRGTFAFSKLDIKPYDLSQEINWDSTRFFCKNNNLIGNSKNINYGSLTSNFNLNIPLNKSSNSFNNIGLSGSIGFIESFNPDIELSGSIPYRFEKRGIVFGNIDSTFNLNRTQLANLNIFRKNDIDGFINAEGKLKGKIRNPDISIDFNIDNPVYKGIRIKETLKGDIKNKNNKYLLRMENKYYSTIPSYLSANFDSKLKLDSFSFNRVFNSERSIIKMAREKNTYIWSAENFPLDELELSLRNNQFYKIKGIINGAGSISLDQSNFDGRLALSLGKYRNIKLANSLFDFSLKDKSFYVNSSLYPIDGGIIEFEYNSKNNNLVNLDFNNISTNWTILTAIDIFNYKDKKATTSDINVLDDFEINKENNSFKDKIDFINKINSSKKDFEDKFNLQKYFSKFKSRYNGKVTIKRDRTLNYKLNTKLNGYLDVSRDDKKNKKEEFFIDLEGGLLKDKGRLIIKKFPLSAANIFLNQQRDFLGRVDINLSYDFDEKYFESKIYSNNAIINNNELFFNNGEIKFANSIFKINFPFYINDSKKPNYIKGYIPLNYKENVDLRFSANGKFVELIDIFAGDYFTFKEGSLNLGGIIKGPLNKPLLNGYLEIKDSDIEIYNTIIKDLKGKIIFDFDKLTIEEEIKAKAGDYGDISIKGSLPFYGKNNLDKEEIKNNKKCSKESQRICLKSKEFALKTNNADFLLDSKLYLSGSFENPVLRGNLSLNNGFIDFYKTSNNNKEINTKINQKEDRKTWPELSWDSKKKLRIVSNETILNSDLLGKTFPNYLDNLIFSNLKLKLGPDFKIQFSESIQAYLNTIPKFDLNVKGEVGNNLKVRGYINLEKGRANLYTTPFKLDKNNDNHILFAERSGIVPLIDFSLVSKVPDSIIPIRENNQDPNISGDLDSDAISNGFGTFGIGNSRLIKIEASYKGFLDQLSFDDENKKIQLRSTPSYNRSQIIGLIGGNSANLINRAFISQINNADAFSERFQLSLYPALIENNDSLNNIFSNENIDLNNDFTSTTNEPLSSQEWIAELGFDITDFMNFSVQTIPGRNDLPPKGILTLQIDPKNENFDLELLGSSDSNGDWKSQLQLFFRY